MISCENIFFYYPEFKLHIPQLVIKEGSYTILAGPSGSGKSTLLQLIAGILVPSSGRVLHADIDLTRLSEEERCDFRILKLGLVLQEFALLEYLTVVDNILLTYRISGMHSMNKEAIEQAHQLLKWVGLENKQKRFPSQLSQGERQRVAICRALVSRPDVLLFDEPTSNLDKKNRDGILSVLEQYRQVKPHTLVVVTHDDEMYYRADQIINLDRFQS